VSSARATILAVDAAEGVRRLLETTLGKSQVVKTAPDAHSALAWAQLASPPELVLLDTEPTGMSGYELCKALRAMPGFADVPVIFLAERRDTQGLVQGFSLGALDFLVKPLAAPVLLQRIRGHLEQLARERAVGLQGTEQRIARLVRAMHWYERSLGGNRAQRLAQYARALALAAGAREVAAELLAKAAPVHDVGKLAVPAELLRNERTLAGAEREQFERHAAIGAEIIGEHEDALLKLARTLALTHHEYWDGSGYPGRLQGNQIPWAGRVMAIVDAFESTTAAQYGGSRMSTEKAVDEITAGTGTQYDPALIEALRKAAAEFRKVHGAYPERAADAGDDLVIGAPTRPAALPAEEPAAPADDLVLGAPARDPTEDAGLTMMGPLRLNPGAASTDKIREAIQRAAARAQAGQAARRAPEAEPVLDLRLDESVPPPIGKPDELKRAQDALAQARIELQQARSELNALHARMAELEAVRAAAQVVASPPQAELDEARGELQIRTNALEATRAALAQARAELEQARAQPVAEAAPPRAELEALNARIATLVGERAVTETALAQARAELDRAHGELAELRSRPVAADRTNQLEAERAAAAAQLSEALDELERARADLQARVHELAGTTAALVEAHVERERSRAEIEGLRNRVSELELGRVSADAALDERQRRREAAEGELTELQAKALAVPPAEAMEPVRESRPIATLLLVAFLLGALAMGVTYLLFHP